MPRKGAHHIRELLLAPELDRLGPVCWTVLGRREEEDVQIQVADRFPHLPAERTALELVNLDGLRWERAGAALLRKPPACMQSAYFSGPWMNDLILLLEKTWNFTVREIKGSGL